MSQNRVWIAYCSDRDEWKSVYASDAEDAAEEAERASDELDDGSDSWELTWVVALAPDDFDTGRPVFPNPDDFDGEEVTVSVMKEIKYHYRITR